MDNTLEQQLADQQLTEEKLFFLCLDVLKEEFPSAQFEPDPPHKILITLGGRGPATIYTGNLWRVIREQKIGDRISAFERYMRGFYYTIGQDPRPAPQKENIVPLIKDSEYFLPHTSINNFSREHLAGDIWVVYAIDLPEAMVSVNPSTLQELGITPDELRTLACDNLRRILPEIEQHGSGPWYLLTAGGDYVASILLLDEVWEELEDSVEGDIVAVVPSRDVLLFTGSHSKEAIEQIRQKAREIHETGDHVVSQTLLQRKAGQWRVYQEQ